jgi:hypothetical protein
MMYAQLLETTREEGRKMRRRGYPGDPESELLRDGLYLKLRSLEARVNEDCMVMWWVLVDIVELSAQLSVALIGGAPEISHVL